MLETLGLGSQLTRTLPISMLVKISSGKIREL